MFEEINKICKLVVMSSISGSIDKSVDNAVERNCSAFQIFTRSPRSWHAKDLTKEDH